MKAFLLLIIGLMAVSCTGGPSVTRTVKGSYHATAGFTLFAKRENVVAEVATKEGDLIRYSTSGEDSTEVPMSLIRWRYSWKMLKTQQPAILKGTDDPDFIPKDPNNIPKDPNKIPFDPNALP